MWDASALLHQQHGTELMTTPLAPTCCSDRHFSVPAPHTVHLRPLCPSCTESEHAALVHHSKTTKTSRLQFWHGTQHCRTRPTPLMGCQAVSMRAPNAATNTRCKEDCAEEVAKQISPRRNVSGLYLEAEHVRQSSQTPQSLVGIPLKGCEPSCVGLRIQEANAAHRSCQGFRKDLTEYQSYASIKHLMQERSHTQRQQRRLRASDEAG